jgi:hypothetical protein
MYKAKNHRGDVVEAAHAQRAGVYFCLNCNARVIAKATHSYAKNTPHFAHAKMAASPESCELYVESSDIPRKPGFFELPSITGMNAAHSDGLKVVSIGPRIHFSLSSPPRLTLTFNLPPFLHRFSGSLDIEQASFDSLESVYEINSRNASGFHELAISPSFSKGSIRCNGVVDASYKEVIFQAAENFSSSAFIIFSSGVDGGYALPALAPLVEGERYIVMSSSEIKAELYPVVEELELRWDGRFFYALDLKLPMPDAAVIATEKLTGRKIRKPKPTLSMRWPLPKRHDHLGVTYVPNDTPQLTFRSNRPNELEVSSESGESVDIDCTTKGDQLLVDCARHSEVLVTYKGLVLFHIKKTATSANASWLQTVNFGASTSDPLERISWATPGAVVSFQTTPRISNLPRIRHLGTPQDYLTDVERPVMWGDDFDFGAGYFSLLWPKNRGAQMNVSPGERAHVSAQSVNLFTELRSPKKFNVLRSRDLRLRDR